MIRLFLVGFGNVGRELARLLKDGSSPFKDFNTRHFSVTSIATRSHGCLSADEGIDVQKALNYILQKGRFDRGCDGFTNATTDELLQHADYDALVDLSALELKDFARSGAQRLERALRDGKHVVTANKGPIAFHYQKLKTLAQKQQRALLFESTVMDGTPIFNMYRAGLAGAMVKQFSGILNSTTNFLLGELESGVELPAALDKARHLGMVEADANHDLQGWDAALKSAILCNVFFDTQIDPFQIPRDSFERITPEDVQNAKKAGKRLKFVAGGSKENGQIKAWVKLQVLKADHPFFTVDASSSILQIELKNLAALTILQRHPTITDTAYGVISDLLQILKIHKERKTQ
ncbi:homoserine dehydrogenase [Calditrichota bacterium LG25]